MELPQEGEALNGAPYGINRVTHGEQVDLEGSWQEAGRRSERDFLLTGSGVSETDSRDVTKEEKQLRRMKEKQTFAVTPGMNSKERTFQTTCIYSGFAAETISHS